ncbi:uncharacterized protein LOC113216652 [Frankliniella occidentalis]|uniref:Uncharacterized protein LOC113216652 n=1 Tax=Frankliniella occidentalis TaxID=133901 RepID=A0A9C6TW75_FRAOC|nr:uncharacterized protein LOC113216652 [Frankliniella occidentalis]
MAQYAMLATLVLLPLARACSCPPAPAASEVCGSDHVTYPSQCDLECAAWSEFSLHGLAVWRQPSGLSLKHPGPCSPAEVALGRLVDVNDATRPTGGPAQHRPRQRRSATATEELRKVNECAARQCRNVTCKSWCVEEGLCVDMCYINCLCACNAHHHGGTDAELWWKCFGEKGGCEYKHESCKASCKGQQECKSACEVEKRECACQCAQEAHNSTTHDMNSTTSITRSVTNTTEDVTSTTSTWNWRKYTACVEENRECGRGAYGWLRELRRENSTCTCMGLPGGDLDSYGLVGECLEREDCRGREVRCEDACGTEDCRDACRLTELRCRCGCNHRGRASLQHNITNDAEETDEQIKPAQDAK